MRCRCRERADHPSGSGRWRGDHHAQPAGQAQRLQRGDARRARAARSTGSRRDATVRALLPDRQRPAPSAPVRTSATGSWSNRRCPAPTSARPWIALYNPLVRRLHRLERPGGRGGQRGRGRRRRQLWRSPAHLVLAARSARFIQAFSQARPGTGFRRHLRAAAPGRPGPGRWVSPCSASRCRPSRRLPGA